MVSVKTKPPDIGSKVEEPIICTLGKSGKFLSLLARKFDLKITYWCCMVIYFPQGERHGRRE